MTENVSVVLRTIINA